MMKTATVLTLIILVAVLLVTPSHAGNSCGVAVRQQYVAPQKQVQQYQLRHKAYVAPRQQYSAHDAVRQQYDKLIYYSSYDSGEALARQALLQQGEETSARLRLLEKQIELLSLQLQAAQQPAPQAPYNPFNPQQQQQAPPGVFQNKCSRCHDATNAAAKGQGLVLTQGGRLLPPSLEVQHKIIAQIYSDKMPKGQPLTAQEKAQASQELLEATK